MACIGRFLAGFERAVKAIEIEPISWFAFLRYHEKHHNRSIDSSTPLFGISCNANYLAISALPLLV